MWPPPPASLLPSVLPLATWEEAGADPARGVRLEPEPGRPRPSPASRLLPRGAAREAPRSILHNICDAAKPPTEVPTPAASNCSPGLHRRARARAPCPGNCITPARLRWPGQRCRALREQARGDGTEPRIRATAPLPKASPLPGAGSCPCRPQKTHVEHWVLPGGLKQSSSRSGGSSCPFPTSAGAFGTPNIDTRAGREEQHAANAGIISQPRHSRAPGSALQSRD